LHVILSHQVMNRVTSVTNANLRFTDRRGQTITHTAE